MFQRNPEKLEQKALDYERRGKTAKAQKYREKAARLRGGNTHVSQTAATGTSTPYFTSRSPQTYESNALKWEQRGNWQKAQKNREKVWRLQNPQFPATHPAPNFYENNRFLGYNLPAQQGLMQGTTLNKGMPTGGQIPATIHHVMPTVVETHVHPTLYQQTVRPEKIIEVQPVVHREIDAPQVHVVEKHSYEQVRSTGPSTITNQPIVEETIRPRVIEEIQPVVHREVPAPFVERVEQHVTEHVTQPTTMTKDIINEGLRTQPMGIAAGAPIGQPGFQQQGMLPGQQGMLPGQQGMLPGQQGMLPGQQGMLPGQQGMLPGQQGMLPGQQGMLPGQQGLAGQNLQSGIRPGMQQPGLTQPGLAQQQPPLRR